MEILGTPFGEPILVATISLAFVTAILAVATIKLSIEARKQVEILLLSEILRQTSTEKMRERRARIYKERESIRKGEVSEELATDIEEVAVAFDRMAFLIRENRGLEERVKGWIGDTIVDTWNRIEPYVIEKVRGETYEKELPKERGRKNFVKHFEELAKKCADEE